MKLFQLVYQFCCLETRSGKVCIRFVVNLPNYLKLNIWKTKSILASAESQFRWCCWLSKSIIAFNIPHLQHPAGTSDGSDIHVSDIFLIKVLQWASLRKCISKHTFTSNVSDSKINIAQLYFILYIVNLSHKNARVLCHFYCSLLDVFIHGTFGICRESQPTLEFFQYN